MQKRIVLCPVLVMFSWIYLFAQPSSSSFLHYTSDQGLSNDHITSITKDKLGFMWIGTASGLNRFDGRSFKVFRHDPKNEHTIPEDVIMHVALAPDGWLWIATTGGLCKLDPVWLDIKRIPLPENADTLDNDAVTMIGFDSKGMAWTTGDQGIYKVNTISDTVEYFYKTKLNALGWFGMLIDKEDRVWMLKDSLRRFDPSTQRIKTFNGIDPKESLYLAGALSIVQDDAGQLWVGTWGSGIWKYDVERDEFVKRPHSYSLAMMVLPDTVEGKQFFWVGGGKSGLSIYYPDKEEFIEMISNPQDPFTHNNYLAIVFFKDTSTGDVWIGTEVGLEHYAPATIRFGRAIVPTEEDWGQFSLVSGVAHDITDPGGQRYFVALWGTGLFSWNKTTGEFTRMKSAISNMTSGDNFNLFQDSRGYLWSCMKGGIGRYNPRTGEFRDYVNFFAHNERNNLFWCGLEDRQGNLWFGSNKEGLFRYNPKADHIELAFYKEEYADNQGHSNILAISEDTLGRLWLACGNRSLVRFDPATGESRKFSYASQDIQLDCSDVEVGNNGLVYAAFYGSFLELDMDGKLLRHFNRQNGLQTNRIYFIAEDHQGKIWFNSVYLLHRFDPVSGTFNYYGKADGLFSNIMTDALSITPSGEIFVGFQNAFNFFYPDRLRRNLQPPPIAITSIKVMNKERTVNTNESKTLFGLFPSKRKKIRQDSLLTLKPGEDFFEIEFAALNFNQQERNRYAYLLEGFNKDWVYTDRPVAIFTNLDGGTYLLRMKAANNDGVWNEKGATLKIHVNPSFYRTRWFPVLIGLAIAVIVAGFLWYRRQQRRRLEKFRESLARDLHDEMGSTLSSIRFFSEFANQQIGNDKPMVTPMLQRISQSASTLSESMQDIVWAMKTQNDQLEDLAAHMTEFALRLLEARNVKLKTNISKEFSGKQLQPEVRRIVYLIFKEAVNNAAKYSEATEVELDLGIKRGLLSMKISDNGKGFEMGSSLAEGRGNGLQNMQQRAADIGGKVDIVSRPGEGTTVELHVKV